MVPKTESYIAFPEMTFDSIELKTEQQFPNYVMF